MNIAAWIAIVTTIIGLISSFFAGRMHGISSVQKKEAEIAVQTKAALAKSDAATDVKTNAEVKSVQDRVQTTLATPPTDAQIIDFIDRSKTP